MAGFQICTEGSGCKRRFPYLTIRSILLFLTPGKGDAGAIELIVFRLIQAVGAAFTFSNSAAILTDVFPVDERGKALGLNQISFLSGQFIGLVLGGILAYYNWRYVFLVSVPVGILGTVWAFLKLKETAHPGHIQKIDVWGNVSFIAGLTIFLIGITYALLPLGNDPMGWENPLVLISLLTGIVLLVAFVFIEKRVKDPMFRLDLFRIRTFSYANTAGFLSAISRGGVFFILIMLLQGIWLPLQGYRLRIDTILGRYFHVASHIRFRCHGTTVGLVVKQVTDPAGSAQQG